MNFEKSSFSRMKDPVSRLKRERQRIRRQVRLNAGGNNVHCYIVLLYMSIQYMYGYMYWHSVLFY